MLRVAMTVAACTVIRCGSSFVGPDAQLPDAFAGDWRSITPSFEFLRLSVFTSSGETCGVAARLTFSGVAWEGNGRISGDSLVFQMSRLSGRRHRQDPSWHTHGTRARFASRCGPRTPHRWT